MEVASRFRSLLEQNGVAGGMIAVVCDRDRAFQSAVGVRRRGSGEPVTTQTRFQWASTTKMFTAAAIMALVEQGALDLHAPISTYLPPANFGELSFGGRTLHQLLTHTSGYPTGFENFDPDLEQVVRSNAQAPMWSNPEQVFNYSNPGFTIAGLVLQQVAGMPFAEIVAKEILRPAGMTATFDAAEVQRGEYASGHSNLPPFADAPIGPVDSYFHTGYYAPMGGLWGDAHDFVRWMQVHLRDGDGVLGAESMDSLRTPRTRTIYPGLQYGYGHFVDDSIRPTVVHHGGSAPGFQTGFRVIPEAGFGIAVAINGDDFFPTELIEAATEMFVELEYLPVTVPPERDRYARYVGVYDDPQVFGRVEVIEMGGALRVRFGTDPEIPLMSSYGSTYETMFGGERIDWNFWLPPDGGSATHIVSAWGVAKRVER
ncbi:MAG: serine hydrolase domain-containing protein [Myxococcota bacterium]